MAFQCSHCKSTFFKNKTLRQHVKAKHAGMDLPPRLPVGRKAKPSVPTWSGENEPAATAEFGTFMAFQCEAKRSLPTQSVEDERTATAEFGTVVAFQCGHCKSTFRKNKTLRQHVKAKHAGVDLPPRLPVGRKAKRSVPTWFVEDERAASAEFGMRNLLFAVSFAEFNYIVHACTLFSIRIRYVGLVVLETAVLVLRLEFCGHGLDLGLEALVSVVFETDQ